MLIQAQKELGREPTEEELKKALQRDVDRDILVREALRLKLHVNDTNVSNRLAQKMEFVLAGDIPKPDEKELRKFHASHNAYKNETRYSFTEVRFPATASVTNPNAALARLRAGSDPGTVGGRVARVSAANMQTLRRRVPPQVLEALTSAKPSQWRRVTLPNATSLIRLDSAEESAPLAYEKMRARVKADWTKAQREKAVERALIELRKQYGVAP